jgi:hypothetical protein
MLLQRIESALQTLQHLQHAGAVSASGAGFEFNQDGALDKQLILDVGQVAFDIGHLTDDTVTLITQRPHIAMDALYQLAEHVQIYISHYDAL